MITQQLHLIGSRGAQVLLEVKKDAQGISFYLGDATDPFCTITLDEAVALYQGFRHREPWSSENGKLSFGVLSGPHDYIFKIGGIGYITNDYRRLNEVLRDMAG